MYRSTGPRRFFHNFDMNIVSKLDFILKMTMTGTFTVTRGSLSHRKTLANKSKYGSLYASFWVSSNNQTGICFIYTNIYSYIIVSKIKTKERRGI